MSTAVFLCHRPTDGMGSLTISPGVTGNSSQIKCSLPSTSVVKPTVTKTFEFEYVTNDSQDAQSKLLQGLTNHIKTSREPATVFFYGPVGSGKTRNYESTVKTFLKEVFSDSRLSEESQIQVEYLEFESGNAMSDLLKASPSDAGELKIWENAEGKITVHNLTREPVTRYSDALASFFTGNDLRIVGPHAKNPKSSKCHGIFTVIITGRHEGRNCVTKVNFVDLAGVDSEENNSNGITQSLSYLEQVLQGMHKIPAVSFRSHKLTHLLKDACTANSKIFAFVSLLSDEHSLKDNLHALTFAQSISAKKYAGHVVYEDSKDEQIQYLKKEVAQLKKELKLHDSLAGRNKPVKHEELSSEDVRDLTVSVEMFLQNPVNKIQVESYRQIEETFNIFRKIIESMKAASKQANPVPVAAPVANPQKFQGAVVIEGKVDANPKRDSLKTNDPGNLVAPDNSRPPFIQGGKNPEDFVNENINSSSDLLDSNIFSPLALYNTLVNKIKRETQEETATAFIKFKSLDENAKLVIEKHQELVHTLNARKSDLKQLRAELRVLRESLISSGSQDRTNFDEKYNEAAQIEHEISTLSETIQSCKSELLDSFQIWYAKHRPNRYVAISKSLAARAAEEKDSKEFSQAKEKARIRVNRHLS
jgi:Kinesin motor domain